MKKDFIYYNTASKSVWKGGGYNPGESRVCKVGKHKVILTRAERLDRFGNPVYIGTVLKKDGSSGKPYKTNSSPTGAAIGALHGEGVLTKYSNTRRKK